MRNNTSNQHFFTSRW